MTLFPPTEIVFAISIDFPALRSVAKSLVVFDILAALPNNPTLDNAETVPVAGIIIPTNDATVGTPERNHSLVEGFNGFSYIGAASATYSFKLEPALDNQFSQSPSPPEIISPQ